MSNERSKDPSHRRTMYHPPTLDWLTSNNQFRWRRVNNDPVFVEMRSDLGHDELLNLIWAGDLELEERQKIHNQLYGDISASASVVGINRRIIAPKSEYFSVEHHQDHFGQGLVRNPYYYMAKVSEIGFAQIEKDQDIHPTNPQEATLRRKVLAKALSILDIRSLAMSYAEQTHFEEQVDFFRDQSYRSEFSKLYYNALLEHYHLDSSKDTVIHLLTRGVQAPKHAILSLLAHYPDSNVVTMGGLYFETRKFFDRLKYMGFQSPEVSTIQEPSIEEIRNYISKAAENNKPTIVLADPIESFDLQQLESADIQKVMKLHHIQSILELATSSFKGETPFFLLTDITNTGGVFQIFDKSKPITKGSNVNIMAVQSLYKFFEYGLDTTSLGALIAHGPAFKDKGEGSLDERMIVALNLLNMGPGISEIALMPPLNSQYMQYRADRITRNTSVILNILKEKLHCSIELSHPSLRPDEADRGAFIEFLGPYFFIKMPDENSAIRVEESIKGQSNKHLGIIDYGSSFGYDSTRLERFGDIVRVSTGTEDICHITFTAYRLSQMLREAMG